MKKTSRLRNVDSASAVANFCGLPGNLPERPDRSEDHYGLMSPDQNPPLLNHAGFSFGAVRRVRIVIEIQSEVLIHRNANEVRSEIEPDVVVSRFAAAIDGREGTYV